MWILLKTLHCEVCGVVCLWAGLPSSIYVPNELSIDSVNSNGLFQDKKHVFSAACPTTLPKIERLSLDFNAWWLLLTRLMHKL